MGYIDFDGLRYWDVREQVNYFIKGVDLDKGALPSDSRKRIDTVAYKAGDMAQAQENKNTIEIIQRKDRKLREAAEKRREEGGKKIDYSLYKDHPLCSATN